MLGAPASRRRGLGSGSERLTVIIRRPDDMAGRPTDDMMCRQQLTLRGRVLLSDGALRGPHVHDTGADRGHADR
ncbi:Protein of unknown function [Micromonospora lupini str. Lupac 08]|uniref:Uncharacterized protein n=1 Tax=Micromonospora lupini str. Lupac 08 TaxID=1150864 RepID=I0L5V4_9ACTN|nr:Protein of unknown function [Micromonospora lupini str. Lupac 08]